MTFHVVDPMSCASPPTAPSRPRSGRWLATLAALLGAAALASFNPITAHAASSIQWSDTCPPPPPGAQYGSDGQLCAMVQVPLDYRSPAGQQISIAVSMIPAAKPSARRGVLLLNPGGPGGSGLDMPRVMTTLFQGGSGQAVLDEYDLIGFDPRGIGHSTPLSCGLTEQEADQALVPLEQDHSFDATVAFIQQVATNCIQTNGTLVRYVTTANTARDLEVIRQALGETKVNYFAWSYGTYLGAVYATLFPNNTDRFVLDSNVDPNWLWRTVFRMWGLGGDERWPDFANWAAARDATYHFGNTPDQVTALYYQLYDKVDANPLTGVLTDGTPVNGPMFRELTFSSLERDVSFPDLAGFWQLVQSSGSAATAARSSTAGSNAIAGLPAQASAPSSASLNPGLAPVAPRDIQVPVDNLAASALAIVCDDVAWSHSVGQYRREYSVDQQVHPMFGALGSNIWECAFWPYAPLEAPVQITSNGPANVLMLQNMRDPNTPYIGALELHAALGQRSRLVSADAGGHGVYGLGDNICAANVATAYLANGVFPSHDVYCPANPTSATAAAEQSTAREQLRRALRLRTTPLKRPF